MNRFLIWIAIWMLWPAMAWAQDNGVPVNTVSQQGAPSDSADTESVNGNEPRGSTSGAVENFPQLPVSPDKPDATASKAADETSARIEADEAKRLAGVIAQLDAGEPSLDSLIQAALKLADADVAGAASLMRRVRLSPLLPTMKVSADYDLEHDESLDRTQTKPDAWGADTDRDAGFQVVLQWELDKLIFHPDELKIYNVLADRAERREAITSVIIGYWFERRQLQIQLALRPPKDGSERIRLRLRMNELSQRIDSLTGGLLARKY
ncbi:MAG: hypothetical protein JXR76_03550 [Deltaproteobacteria bacterium]|nr:hypothetical protein [Deltaproteobacteria bacterium]